MVSSFMQTFTFIYVLLVLTCTASFLSHDQECLALFEFKQTFLHQNYPYFDTHRFQKFESWRKITNNNTLDCCLWDGVVCSNKGHVIELDLSRSSLTGVINSSSTLFMLVHLQMLNLSVNRFVESEIPSEIAKLKQLRALDLSNSGFSGRIPKEISQLIQLSLLDLSWNPLKLQSHGLECLLQNMTRLITLRLSGVDLNSSVPRFLANFSSLSYIELVDCRLQDEFPSAILLLPKLKFDNSNLTGSLPEFHNTTLLEVLSLFSTGFTGMISESISNLYHLKVLDLQECYFSGRIPGSLPNLTQLTFLCIKRNDFVGLVPSLASLSKLTHLELGYNSLELGRTYDWINKLTNLNNLDLDYMNIHDEFLSNLANLTKLRIVSIRRNFISGPIPSSFMNLTRLTYINLRINQLQGQISSSFLNFKSLEYLDVCANNFSGKVGIDSFLGLNKLKFLRLDLNNLSFVTTNNHTNDTLPGLKFLDLSSCNLKAFPAFLRFQMKMSVIVLDDNDIEGVVPKWIWNNSQETLQIFGLGKNIITGFDEHPSFLPWIRLEVFYMKDNQLQGRLPIPPRTIVVYDASNNNLTGEIPPLICEMKSLQFLYLSSNKMTGALPPCLSNLSNSLSYLDLKGNDFHGPMMNTFTHGCMMKTIDLTENRFTGPLSKSLANCKNLEFLAVGDNIFEDVFPLWLGSLPILQVLILRSNKFYGAIQDLSTFSSQFHELRIIDISNNHFSGHLSDKSFESWSAMKNASHDGSSVMGSHIPFDMFVPFSFQYSMMFTNKGVKREYVKILAVFTAIDLSRNNFEGRIPHSLDDLHGLKSLNLSNNHFTGSISPSLGNLKNLESLDLSQNELTGQIPQQLLQIGFLAIFNVSFNHLNGRIPQGGQFNTFENNSYMDNPGLCGKPLSKDCGNSKVSTVISPTSNNEYESLLPNDIVDWIVIVLGFGSGMVIGIVIGSFLYARYGIIGPLNKLG